MHELEEFDYFWRTSLVRRPGLEPGTCCLRESLGWVSYVGLVAYVVCFQEILLSRVGLVSWCCGNMRPKPQSTVELSSLVKFGHRGIADRRGGDTFGNHLTRGRVEPHFRRGVLLVRAGSRRVVRGRPHCRVVQVCSFTRRAKHALHCAAQGQCVGRCK